MYTPTNEERRSIIGGSDIAAIMGRSRWRSPLRVWAEKTGRIEPTDLSDVERVEIGRDLEDYVATKFAQKTGYKVRRDNRTFTHPSHEFMVGHIDRRVVGEEAILECKTTSAYNEKEWLDTKMPVEYVLQVMWYLGLAKAATGYAACLIGGQKFEWKQIEFDKGVFSDMVQAAADFWFHHILTGEPPIAMQDDDDTLLDLYPTSSGAIVTLEGEEAERVAGLITRKIELDGRTKEVEAESDLVKNQIRAIIGESDGVDVGTHIATWKNQGRTSVDTELMKTEGIYEHYTKQSTFRVLRTKTK